MPINRSELNLTELTELTQPLELRNLQPEKIAYGFYNNVLLNDEEYLKLFEFYGPEKVEEISAAYKNTKFMNKVKILELIDLLTMRLGEISSVAEVLGNSMYYENNKNPTYKAAYAIQFMTRDLEFEVIKFYDEFRK